MEFRILHLYYDIRDLYGEYGNVSAAERYLGAGGRNAVIDRCTFGDWPDLSEYSFVYIGSGTEKAEFSVLEDIKKHRENISRALENNVPLLATGNSFELFGDKITDSSGIEHEGLSLFGFRTSVSGSQRTLCDQICTSEISGLPFVGFINKASSTEGIHEPMFKVIHGAGNCEGDRSEGIRHGSFFGTHLTGPCLVKNPHLAEFFVKLIDEREGVPFVPFECEYEKKAYRITYDALNERFSKK